jgi:hypothetical protein
MRGVMFGEVRGGADERARIGASVSGEWEGEVVEAGVFGGGIAAGVLFSDGGEGAAAVGFVLAAARLIQVPGGFGIGQGIVAPALLGEGFDAQLAVEPEAEVLRGEAAREVLVAAGDSRASGRGSGDRPGRR